MATPAWLQGLGLEEVGERGTLGGWLYRHPLIGVDIEVRAEGDKAELRMECAGESITMESYPYEGRLAELMGPRKFMQPKIAATSDISPDDARRFAAALQLAATIAEAYNAHRAQEAK